MISRRTLFGWLASLPLLASHRAFAQPPGQPIVSRIRLEHRRVWVPVHFGARGPYQFIIDTGAIVSLIQRETARELGLRRVGTSRLTGVGGDDAFEIFEGRDVVFGGGIRQESAVFAAPTRRLGLGPDAAGALAAGVMTALDSELDFEASEWRVYPNGRGERPGFELLPSEITGGGGREGSPRLYVDVGIDGRSYRLLVDTGAPGQLSLMPPAVRRSGLWSDGQPFAPYQPRGLGGAARRGRLVRAGRVTIGGITIERPIVGLHDPRGANDAGGDGIIGLELLEQLTLSTDARAGRLWARRNSRPAPRGRYGMSGLWSEERNGRVFIVEVAPGSPGAEAGLAIGDEVLGMTVQQLVERLSGAPGDSLGLTVRRGGRTIEVPLTLREYL